jgi:hypothetical protein
VSPREVIARKSRRLRRLEFAEIVGIMALEKEAKRPSADKPFALPAIANSSRFHFIIVITSLRQKLM